VGAVVGILALIYLVVNHPLGLIWRSLPAKELAIGILFAAGTIVALLPRIPLTTGFALATVSFAALCSLNCISIARWEGDLDRAQGKVSIATRHPRAVRYVGRISVVLAFAVFALAIVFPLGAPIFTCIGVSALLLTWLNASPGSLGTNERTALADLVLLTPVIALIIASL
jgi:hypothetical protein